MNAQQIAVTAQQLGANAFNAGKPAVPELDDALTVLMRRGHALVAVAAWITGWHTADVNAPALVVRQR